MVNGRAWTFGEAERLRKTVEAAGNTIVLAIELERSHDALMAKAKSMKLVFP